MPYELRMLPFPPRAAAPDYLARNPLGTIPLLEDGDVRMTELAAICQDPVSRYGPSPLDVAPEEPGYAAFLNGLHFGEATLTFPQTLVLRYRRLEPPERRLPQVTEDYERWFLSRLRKGLEALEGGYYAAGRFTAADVSIGYALLLAGKSRVGRAVHAGGGRLLGAAFGAARLPARPGGAASGSGGTERAAHGLQRAGLVLIRQPARPDFAVRGPHKDDEGGYDDRLRTASHMSMVRPTSRCSARPSGKHWTALPRHGRTEPP